MPDMTNGWIACIRRLDSSRFPNGDLQLCSAPFSSLTLAEQWTVAFPDCVCLHVNQLRVPTDSIVNDLVPVVQGKYTNYLNRDDCIDHGLHMMEVDDAEYCEHCEHCGTQDELEPLLPGGMSFVFDILDNTGKVMKTIVIDTDNPLDAIVVYEVEMGITSGALAKMGWSVREIT